MNSGAENRGGIIMSPDNGGSSNLSTTGSLSLNHSIYFGDLVREAKSSMQIDNDSEKKNGVTYALFGGSGSGKSTLLRKVFIDDVYSNQRIVKKEDEFISLFFTESKHADPLKGLHGEGEDTILDACGFDQDVISWMYAMNYTYEKRYNFVVISDDVIGVKHLPIVYKMFLTFRNMNVTSMVSLQYMKHCPLSVRGSLYFVIILANSNDEAARQVVEAYLMHYLPGTSLVAKLSHFKDMVAGYQFFFVDNLNHKCYHVNSDYQACELPKRPPEEMFNRSSSSAPSISSNEEFGGDLIQNAVEEDENRDRKRMKIY